MVQCYPPRKIFPVDLSKFFSIHLWDPFSSNSAPLVFFAASGFREKRQDQRRTNFVSIPQEISHAREKATYLAFFLVIENG